MFFSPTFSAALLALPLLPIVSAGMDFTNSCPNYYVGNGVADSTADLFLESWCNGGQTETGEARPALCTRLNLSDCFKVVDGDLTPYDEAEPPNNADLPAKCDIASCAMRGDPWNGPVLSCYCQDNAGIWDLVDVNLNRHVGNEGGFLACGKVIGTKTCKYPWTGEDGQEEGELR